MEKFEFNTFVSDATILGSSKDKIRQQLSQEFTDLINKLNIDPRSIEHAGDSITRSEDISFDGINVKILFIGNRTDYSTFENTCMIRSVTDKILVS